MTLRSSRPVDETVDIPVNIHSMGRVAPKFMYPKGL